MSIHHILDSGLQSAENWKNLHLHDLKVDNKVNINVYTPYVVSDDGSSAYSSIQDAIDQAVLDGATDSNAALVIVKIGNYTENVTLAAGVYIRGFGNCAVQAFGVTLTGNVNASYIGTCTMDNINLVGTLTLDGTNATKYYSECSNYSGGINSSIVCTNPNAEFLLFKCFIRGCDGSLVPTLDLQAGSQLNFIFCQAQPNPLYATQGAYSINCQCTLFNGYVGLPIEVGALGNVVSFYNFYQNPDSVGSTPTITIAAGGSMLLMHGVVAQFNLTNNIVDGAGTLTYGLNVLFNPLSVVSGTITANAMTVL